MTQIGAAICGGRWSLPYEFDPGDPRLNGAIVLRGYNAAIVGLRGNPARVAYSAAAMMSVLVDRGATERQARSHVLMLSRAKWVDRGPIIIDDLPK